MQRVEHFGPKTAGKMAGPRRISRPARVRRPRMTNRGVLTRLTPAACQAKSDDDRAASQSSDRRWRSNGSDEPTVCPAPAGSGRSSFLTRLSRIRGRCPRMRQFIVVLDDLAETSSRAGMAKTCGSTG